MNFSFDPELAELYKKHSPPLTNERVGENIETQKIYPAQYQKALDLHGYTKYEALEKTEWFLNNAEHKNLQRVRIITGKGESSQYGPVLFPAIKKYLQTQKDKHRIQNFTAQNGVFEIYL